MNYQSAFIYMFYEKKNSKHLKGHKQDHANIKTSGYDCKMLAFNRNTIDYLCQLTFKFKMADHLMGIKRIQFMKPLKGHTLLACLMVCNRSWHLPGNPARLVKEWGCVDLSMDTMHPLVLFGFEGSALSLPLFLLSHALPLFFINVKGPL